MLETEGGTLYCTLLRTQLVRGSGPIVRQAT